MKKKQSRLIVDSELRERILERASCIRRRRHRSCLFLAAVGLPLLTAPAIAGSTTVRVEWGSSQGIAVFQPGDRVRIQSRLTTTDPHTRHSDRLAGAFGTAHVQGGLEPISGLKWGSRSGGRRIMPNCSERSLLCKCPSS